MHVQQDFLGLVTLLELPEDYDEAVSQQETGPA